MLHTIEKTTYEQRLTITNALFPSVCGLERANTLLWSVIEENFSDAEQKHLDRDQAEWVGTVLLIVSDIIDDTIEQYYLTTHDVGSERVAKYLKQAEQVANATKCEELHNIERQWEHTLPQGKLETVAARRIEICRMEDEEAIEALTQLMANS